jgi:hypothetical protein
MRLILVLLTFLVACSSKVPAPSSLPEQFPVVAGESLTKEEVEIPAAYLGKPVVYLIGLKQKAQFDIDRWILGMLQLETPATIVELPTIQGMPASMVSELITGGMRKGIPENEWSSVITLFDDDADTIVNQFGNERPQSAYVVLVDKNGSIRWFYNNGYSGANMQTLDKAVRQL